MCFDNLNFKGEKGSKMIKIGIIDDNIQLTEVIEDYLSTLEEMEVIGVAHNGLDGMKLIKSAKPDLVILDLIIPQLDGLSLLEQLYVEKIGTKVLILTAFVKEDIIKKANELGVSYFLSKPFDLTQLEDTIRKICCKRGFSSYTSMNSEQKINKKDNKLIVKISEILHSMGIPANLKGYLFLREAIEMAVYNSELLSSISKNIYPTIANKYHTTSSRVERAIRHSIEVGWKRGHMEQLNFSFGSTMSSLKKKPSNGKLIALIANHLVT